MLEAWKPLELFAGGLFLEIIMSYKVLIILFLGNEN